jgi:hypothetical protein
MKRITVLLLTISTILCLTSGSSRAQQSPANSQRVLTEKNTLIVYLSRTNNTKAIAEIIHQKVGGTLVALELQTPYPTDYRATVQQVVRENETGYRLLAAYSSPKGYWLLADPQVYVDYTHSNRTDFAPAFEAGKMVAPLTGVWIRAGGHVAGNWAKQTWMLSGGIRFILLPGMKR